MSALVINHQQPAPVLNVRTNRSSAVKDQERRITEALEIRPHTTEDFRKIGIFQISARIWGLRAQGWEIKTDRVTVIDREGYHHPRSALYSLVSTLQKGNE